MMRVLITVFALAWCFHDAMCGSPCPSFGSIQPCYCSHTDDAKTIVTCSGIDNITLLTKATDSMKSMIVDRLVLLGSFHNDNSFENQNEIEEELINDVNGGERLPENWLVSSRVRVVEMQDVKISNCFLCKDPFYGQDDFLVSLTVTHSSLEGNLCSVCNTKVKSISTRYLQKMKNMNEINFSFNNIEVVSGNAFPATLEQLKKITLSNNQITRIHDNAFSNLNQVKELDLSNNKLVHISRKIFRSVDNSLESVDFSWNYIQNLPEDLFLNMRGLKEIKLGNNHLEVLSATTFSRLPALFEKADVKGNFVVCNCSLSWINKKLSKSIKLTGKCVAPKEVEFNDIKSNMNVLQNCPN